MEVKMNVKDFTKNLNDNEKVGLAKSLLVEVAMNNNSETLNELAKKISVFHK